MSNEAEAPKGGIPYIGSRISLISKTDIRYEGILFNIDTRESMVALQNVRSFGTEGRRAEHVAPSDHVLQYATFKASEIKDLHVCEAAPAQVPPPPLPTAVPYTPPPVTPSPPMPPSYPPTNYATTPPQNHPAPTSLPPPPPTQDSQKTKRPTSASKSPVLLTPGSVASNTQPPPPQSTPQENEPPQYVTSTQEVDEQQSKSSQNTNTQRNNARNSSRTIPGMGGHLLKRKERRVHGGDATQPSSVQAADFDFEEGLDGFDKEVEFSKLTVGEVKGTSYKKSSFFDTISCDALDRLEGQNRRMTGQEERKLNTETFGAVGLNNNRRNYRNNGTGRGRGGRGGGRGRGRGGNFRRNWNGSQGGNNNYSRSDGNLSQVASS